MIQSTLIHFIVLTTLWYRYSQYAYATNKQTLRVEKGGVHKYTHLGWTEIQTQTGSGDCDCCHLLSKFNPLYTRRKLSLSHRVSGKD